MNKFIKKALSTSLALGLTVLMGTSMVTPVMANSHQDREAFVPRMQTLSPEERAARQRLNEDLMAQLETIEVNGFSGVAQGMVPFVVQQHNEVSTSAMAVFPNGHQVVRVADENAIQAFGSTENATIEINVESPIMDLVGHTMDVDVQQLVESLFNITSQDNQLRTTAPFVQDEEVLAAHQERIDEILALVNEQGVDNLDDLFLLLDALQYENGYVPIAPLWCESGVCHTIPVWVWIDGIRLPGYQCRDCGRVFIFFG